MKYLKKFEALSDSEYKEGDYVLLDIKKIISNNKDNEYDMDDNIPIDELAIIKSVTVELDDGFLYTIIFYDYDEEEDNSYGVESDEIIRKLIPSEIEYFKMKKNTSKYNI